MKFRLTAIVLALCLLILPMNVTAIVVGEDTAPAGYIEYLQYDIDTRETTTQYAPINNSTETWSLFTEREVAQMEAAVDAAQNEIGTNAIIGEDDRYETPPTTGTVFASVVLMRAYWDENGDGLTDSISRGTGFFVSKNVIVSAAHCAVPQNTAEETLLELRIYVGVHLDNASIGSTPYITADNISWAYAWHDPTNGFKHDYCTIVLNQDVPRSIYFNCVPASNVSSSQLVTVSGYPGDKNYEQWTSSAGNITYLDSYYFKYDNDTYSGTSGGPVYRATMMCVGINAYSHDDDVPLFNQGVLFHSQAYSLVCTKIENNQ